MQVLRRPQSNDPDVVAFLVATGITDNTIIRSLNKLVSSLKTNGIWTKLVAIYPLVGGTATTHKYNLKNPLDTDGAFRITWHGSQTHDASGVVGTGGSDYADTHLVPSSDIPSNEGSSGCYLEGFTFSGFGINSSDGCRTTGSNLFIYTACWSDGNCYYNANGGGSNFTAFSSFSITTRGFLQNTRKDSGNSYFQIGTTRVSYSSSYAAPNNNFYFLGENTNGTPSFFSGSQRKYKFMFIGKAMTTTNMDDFNTAVSQFQTDLGR